MAVARIREKDDQGHRQGAAADGALDLLAVDLGHDEPGCAGDGPAHRPDGHAAVIAAQGRSGLARHRHGGGKPRGADGQAQFHGRALCGGAARSEKRTSSPSRRTSSVSALGLGVGQDWIRG